MAFPPVAGSQELSVTTSRANVRSLGNEPATGGRDHGDNRSRTRNIGAAYLEHAKSQKPVFTLQEDSEHGLPARPRLR